MFGNDKAMSGTLVALVGDLTNQIEVHDIDDGKCTGRQYYFAWNRRVVMCRKIGIACRCIGWY